MDEGVDCWEVDGGRGNEASFTRAIEPANTGKDRLAPPEPLRRVFIEAAEDVAAEDVVEVDVVEVDAGHVIGGVDDAFAFGPVARGADCAVSCWIEASKDSRSLKRMQEFCCVDDPLASPFNPTASSSLREAYKEGEMLTLS